MSETIYRNAPAPRKDGMLARIASRFKAMVVDPWLPGSSGGWNGGSGTYESASTNGSRGYRWTPANSGPNASIGGGLDTMRTRSRDRRRNDGTADCVIEVLTAHIVGTGIRPMWNTGDPKFDAELAQKFADWVKISDADGDSDYYGQQALSCTSMLEGGDCFFRIRIRRPEDNLVVPLQLQLLEGEFCPTNWNRMTASGRVQQGVEFNGIGAKVAYWLWAVHPGDFQAKQLSDPAILQQPKPVPSEFVLHVKNMRRPGQIRGEPWLVRALIKLFDIDQYDDAQLVKQKMSAMFVGVVTTDGSDNPFDPNAAGAPPSGSAGDLAGVDNGRSYPVMEAGTMQALEPGETMEFSSPPTTGDYDPFIKHQTRRVAVATGTLYEQISGDYSNVNDRTWRAAVQEFRRRITKTQGQFVFMVCQPVVERFIDTALLSGAIELPPGVTLEQCKRVRHCPQAWDYINPVQDIAAKKAEARGGYKPRSLQVAEDGYNVHELDEAFEADNARADEKGLVFDTDARYLNEAGAAQQNPAEVGEPDPDSPEGGGGPTPAQQKQQQQPTPTPARKKKAPAKPKKGTQT